MNLQELPDWRLYQTQSVSIPDQTLDAVGEQTFRSNGMIKVQMSAELSNQSLNVNKQQKEDGQKEVLQILATSSIESTPTKVIQKEPVSKKSQSPPSQIKIKSTASKLVADAYKHRKAKALSSA